jgi:hypothetical protein
MQVHISGLLTGASDPGDPENTTPVFKLHDVTVHAGSCTGCVAGDITNVDADDGSFDWMPPAGGTGINAFVLDYRIDDNGVPSPAATSAKATITITVNGPVIWFVDSTAPSGGSGRWTGTNSQAFQTIAAADAVDASGHRIFVINHSPSTVDYTDGIALNSSEWLVGQGATNSPTNTFDALMAISPPTGTVARPSIGGVAPTLQNTVTLNTNARVQGLDLSTGANAAMNDPAGAITGVSVSETNLATTTGAALNIDQVTGALTFGTVTHSGGSGAGVSITNSGAGSTFNFTDVSISSGSSAAFTATGGGTVVVTGTGNNSLTTTTGTALNVANTTIGSGGLHFRSISAGTAGSGPANGILLNNTGTAAGNGGLTVSGTGSAGSGGVIQKSTDSGIQATSTKDLNLSWMTIQNNGNATNEGGVRLVNVVGSGQLTSSTVTGSFEDNVYIANDSGTLTAFPIQGPSCAITDNNSTSGNNGITVIAKTTATMTVTVNNCALHGNLTDAIHADTADTASLTATVTNNIITAGSPNQGNIGLDVSTSGSSTLTYDIESNQIGTNAGSTAPLGNHGINIFAGNNSTATGKVVTNTVKLAGAGASGTGIRLFQQDAGELDARVSNNTVSNVGLDYGIDITDNGSGTSPATVQGKVSVAVLNNNVSVLSTALNSIHVRGRRATATCAAYTGNTGTAGVNAAFHASQADTATFQVLGMTVASHTASEVQSYLAANNTGTAEAFAATNFSGVSLCSDIPPA